MRKKLIAQGPKNRKSYMVTLPIGWIKQFGLDKKREVELKIVGNKVVISARKEIPERVVISADENERYLIKIISLLYRLGVDEIEVRDIKDFKIIDEIIEERLVGFEIISQSKNSCLLKEISTSYSMDFNQIIRRVFLMLLEVAEECRECLEGKNVSTEYLDKGINRLTNFCQRILSKEGHENYEKLPYYHQLCISLEQIADEYKWFCKNAKGKKEKKTLEILRDANSFLRTIYELYFKFDLKKMMKIDREIFKMQTKIFEQVKNPVYTHYLKSILRRLSSLVNVIFSIKYTT